MSDKDMPDRVWLNWEVGDHIYECEPGQGVEYVRVDHLRDEFAGMALIDANGQDIHANTVLWVCLESSFAWNTARATMTRLAEIYKRDRDALQAEVDELKAEKDYFKRCYEDLLERHREPRYLQ